MGFQPKLLVITSLLAMGFVVWLMIGLANFKGHQSKSRERGKPGTNSEAPDGGQLEPGLRARGPTAPNEVAAINLRRLLLKLSRTPQPFTREKIFAQARRRLDEFDSPLLDILGDDEDGLLIAGIDLAEALDLTSAALQLVALAHCDRPSVCAAAIRAKDALDPWGYNELQDFLKMETDPGVLEAVLAIVHRREHRPMAELMALFRHPKATVRAAAAAAIPPLGPGPWLDELCGYAKKAKGREAQSAAEALGHTGVPEQAEMCLLEMLANENRLVRKAALLALRKKNGTITNLEPIFASIVNPELRMHERVLGLWAMEATGTVPVARLKSLMPSLNPMLRLFCARCLFVAGDAAAIPALIDLLDTVESEQVTFNEFLCSTTEARKLLVEVSGRDLGRESEVWRQWHRTKPRIESRELKRNPPTFW